MPAKPVQFHAHCRMADDTRRPSMTFAQENFLRQFRRNTDHEFESITAAELLMIWNHYDKDGDGYLQGEEIDKFLSEFVSSVCDENVGAAVVSEIMMAEMRADFMDAYDDNEDGRIDIRELAEMLPTDETFLLLFQLDNRISSSVDFMTIWRKYDSDHSGSIDAAELQDFLRDLFKQCKPGLEITEVKLDEYANALLRMFDEDKDGKLQLQEMARLIPIKENALKATLHDKFLSNARTLSVADIDQCFDQYDKDGSGEISDDEVWALAKDMMEFMKPNYSNDDVEKFHNMLMKSCDLDGDGSISKEELTVLLLGLQKNLRMSESRASQADDD